MEGKQDKGRIVIALDLGGTLTKMGLWSKDGLDEGQLQKRGMKYEKLIIQVKNEQKGYSNQKQGKFKQQQGQSNKKENIFYLSQFQQFSQVQQILNTFLIAPFDQIFLITTGGGAFKHRQYFQSFKVQHQNSVEVKTQLNEFQAVLGGIKLLKSTEKYRFELKKENKAEISQLVIQGNKNEQESSKHLQSQKVLQWPLIAANVGSGMSLLKIYTQKNSQGQDQVKYERLGGSALGGGFVLGLQRIMNPQFTYDFIQDLLTKSQVENQENDSYKLLKSSILNLSQIISLYSQVSQMPSILITGGLLKSNAIRNLFTKFILSDLQPKNCQKQQQSSKPQPNKKIFFTQIDGWLGIVGLLWKIKQQQ